MASYNKFNAFVASLANGTFNFASDSLIVALTDVAPTSSNAILTDLTQISYTNLSSRAITTTSSTQTSGTYKLLLGTPLTLSATGSVAQFRYVVIYDNQPTNKNLVGWYDYGSEINMINGDQFVITFDGTNGLLQLV